MQWRVATEKKIAPHWGGAFPSFTGCGAGGGSLAAEPPPKQQKRGLPPPSMVLKALNLLTVLTL